jgi:hypothetical protein
MSRLLQVIIALAGLAVSIMLGAESQRAQRAESRQASLGFYTDLVREAETKCQPALATIAEGVLRHLQDTTPEDERRAFDPYVDYQIELLGTIQSGTCGGTTILTQAPALGGEDDVATRGAGPAPAPLDMPAAAAPVIQREHAMANIEMRQIENSTSLAEELRQTTRTARDQLEQSQRYYAVLASYGVDDALTYDARDGVVADYQSLLQHTQAAGVRLKVFRTSASNHFAIVLEPENGARDGARDLVAVARANGWSTDAFVQAGASWIECAEPTSIARGGYDCLNEAQRSRVTSAPLRRAPIRTIRVPLPLGN